MREIEYLSKVFIHTIKYYYGDSYMWQEGYTTLLWVLEAR